MPHCPLKLSHSSEFMSSLLINPRVSIIDPLSDQTVSQVSDMTVDMAGCNHARLGYRHAACRTSTRWGGNSEHRFSIWSVWALFLSRHKAQWQAAIFLRQMCYFLKCAALVSWWIAVCHRGRRAQSSSTLQSRFMSVPPEKWIHLKKKRHHHSWQHSWAAVFVFETFYAPKPFRFPVRKTLHMIPMLVPHCGESSVFQRDEIWNMTGHDSHSRQQAHL